MNDKITVEMTVEFRAWLTGLRDQRAKARIAIRLARLADGNFGDHKRFAGLLELRVDYGPGYRLYAVQRGETLVIVLSGGDKGSQDRDIAKARALAASLPRRSL